MTSGAESSPSPPPPEALAAAARALAERHREPAPPQPERSILNLAESPRDDDWSLRAALVRLAQPEPVRAGAVLEIVRRCQGGLAPLARALERHTVWSEPGLGPGSVTEAAAGGWTLADDGDRRPDIRLADLARLAGGDPAALDVVAGSYGAVAPLDPEEVAALGLVAVAVAIDGLAGELARWAVTAEGPPPLAAVDHLCRRLAPELDRLGVPREIRPEDVPAGARRGGGERGPGRRRPPSGSS
ncbi:MAG: hypothetical protein R2761_16405 [Acidimicrobiales bacterium]